MTGIPFDNVLTRGARPQPSAAAPPPSDNPYETGSGNPYEGTEAAAATPDPGRRVPKVAPDATRVDLPSAARQQFVTEQRKGTAATPERLRGEAARYRGQMLAASAAGRHGEAAAHAARVAGLEHYADALEQTTGLEAGVTQGFLGPIFDPFETEHKIEAEAQQPGALPSISEQRAAGIRKPTSVLPDEGLTTPASLGAMAGQLPYFMVGGMAGRAAAAGAGELLGRSAMPAARTVGELFTRAAQFGEAPELAGPKIPTTSLAGTMARLGEEVQQFRAQLPTLVGRGVTQGQVVGATITYRQARIQGATPEQAFNAAIENAGLSAALGVAGEVIGAGGSAAVRTALDAGRGIELQLPRRGGGPGGDLGDMEIPARVRPGGAPGEGASEPVAPPAVRERNAQDMAIPAKVKSGATAVEEDPLDAILHAGRESPALTPKGRQEVEAAIGLRSARAAAPPPNRPAAEAIADVSHYAEQGVPEATAYQEAINKFVDTAASLKDRMQDGALSLADQVKWSRAQAALNDARRKYGTAIGGAAIVALASNNDSLTEDEKKVVGLAGLALTTDLVRGDQHPALGIMPETREAILKHLAVIQDQVEDNFLTRGEGDRLGGTPRDWSGQLYANGVISDGERSLVEHALNRHALTAQGPLTADDVRQALTPPPDAAQSTGLISRLAATVADRNLLPKKWDEPRPAADWIGKLKGMNQFARGELEYIMPALEEAAQAKRKIDRAGVLNLIDEHAPKITRGTLQDQPRAAVARGGAGAHGNLDPNGDWLELEDALQATDPLVIQDQIARRHNEIASIQSEIEDMQESAAETMSRAEDKRDRYYNDVERVAELYGVSSDVLAPAFDHLADAVGSEYVPNDAIQVAMDEIGDNLLDAVLGSQSAEELLSDNGYTWAEEDEPPPERVRQVEVIHRGTSQNPQAVEGPSNRAGTAYRTSLPDGRIRDLWATQEGRTDELYLAKAREIYGDDAEIRIVTNDDEIANFQPDPANKEWVVRDRHGKEVHRDADKDAALDEAARDQDLTPDLDAAYTAIRDELAAYADALAEYNAAESEHYYRTEDAETAFGEEFSNIERHREEILELEQYHEELRSRPVATDLSSLPGPPPPTTPEEAAKTDPHLMPMLPPSSGGTHYGSYQRIGGGVNYRELVNDWRNAPAGFTRSAFGGHDYWSRAGFDHAVGHIRVEDHTLPAGAVEHGAMSERLEVKPGDEDTGNSISTELAGLKGMSIAWLKRYVNQLREEQAGVRAIQKDIAAKLEALPENERDPSAGISDRAQSLIGQWQTANARLQELGQSETRALEAFPSSEGAEPQQIAVMLETQASLAQHQIGEGIEKRPAADLWAERDKLFGVMYEANTRAEALKQKVSEILDRNDDLGFGHRVDALRALRMEADWRATWEIEDLERDGPTIDEYRQAAREALDAKQKIEALEKQATRAEGQQALGALGTDQKAALTLNAARFLIDSAERGYERIAWSDGANRIENANLAANGGNPLAATKWYDEITPGAMQRLLAGLGFKNVPIDHIAIRGHGHWSIELTPEIRKAIRKTGLPILGLLALAGTPGDAEAQGDNPYGDAGGGQSGVAMAAEGALAAAVIAGAVAYARRRAKSVAALPKPAQSLVAQAMQNATRGAVESVERNANRPGRPDFLFPKREPTGTEYSAPVDVSETKTGKGPALFNIKKLGLSQQGETLFRDVVDQLDLKKRTVTFGETEEEAAKRAVDPEGLLRDKPWTGTDALAARLFQKQAIDRLESLAAKAKDPALTPEEQGVISDEMGRLTADIGEMGTKISREREQAGRTLSAYRIVARSTLDESTWSMLATRAKQLPLTTEEQLQLRDLIAAKDRLGLTSFVSGLHKSSKLDKALAFWKTNLLGLSTVLKVGTSHGLEMADQIIQQPLVVGVDALAALVRGTEREHAGLGPRLGPRLKGLVRGWNEGVKMVRSGSTIPPEMAGRWDVREVNFENPLIRGWVHLVHSVHNLAYRPFYMAALDASMDEVADVYARRAVKADPTLDLDQTKAQLLARPTNEMALRAVDRAERAVFQNKGTLAELGASVQRAARERGQVPQALASTAMPFVKIPANIAMRAIDSSPLGLVTAALRASPWVKGGALVSKQARFAEDVSRALTGTAGFAALGYWLAANGNATGDYPSAPGDKTRWEAEGRQAHSIKIGDRWVNVSDFGPQGMSVALGAQLFEMLQANPDNAGKVLEGMVFATGKTVADEPFLKGIASGLQALNDPVKAGGTYVKSQVGSIVPSMVGRAARTVDPVRRETDGAVEQVESRIPFLSKRLPAKVDAFGREETADAAERALAIPTPVRTTKASDDPVLRELDRLRVPVPGPEAAVYEEGKRVTTTPEERRQDSQFLGPIKYGAAARVAQDPRYESLDDTTKRDLLQRALEVPRVAMHSVDKMGGTMLDDAARTRMIQQMTELQITQLLAEARAGLPVRRGARRTTPGRRPAAANPFP